MHIACNNIFVLFVCDQLFVSSTTNVLSLFSATRTSPLKQSISSIFEDKFNVICRVGINSTIPSIFCFASMVRTLRRYSPFSSKLYRKLFYNSIIRRLHFNFNESIWIDDDCMAIYTRTQQNNDVLENYRLYTSCCLQFNECGMSTSSETVWTIDCAVVINHFFERIVHLFYKFESY